MTCGARLLSIAVASLLAPVCFGACEGRQLHPTKQALEFRSVFEVEVAGVGKMAEEYARSGGFGPTLADADPVIDDAAYPGVGALVYTDANGLDHVQCSAIELDSARVLTAAHCFSGTECFTGKRTTYDKNAYRFFLGESADFPNSVTPVLSWILHEHFVPSTCAADLAIATLGPGADRTTGLMSPADIGPVTPGIEIVKVGYGWFSAHDDHTGALRPAGKRAAARMAITGPPDTQDSSYYRYGPVRNRSSQICSADSGGPAFREDHGRRLLVGITSSGAANGHCRTDPEDTALWHYQDWIGAHASVTSSLDTPPGAPIGLKLEGD